MRTLSSGENCFLTCLAGAVILAASGGAAPAPSGLPQNAALVYYQACLFRYLSLESVSDFYGIVSTTFEPDSDPNATIKSFVRSRDYQFLIELVTAASKLPQCDWGLVRRQWLNVPSEVITRVRDLTHFLVVQAKVSACDGQYRAALENALTLRRMGRHFGDETLTMYIQGEGTKARAFDLIRYLLAKMPPDAETLTWLEKELAAGDEVEWRPRETLTKWLDWEVQCLQASPDVLAGAIKGSALRAKTEGLTPAQALERARLAWDEVFKSVLKVVESEKSPEDKDRELDQLAFDASAKMKDGDPMLLMENLVGAVDLYSGLAYIRARVYAAQAAIAIYHIKATSGQLPQTLPEGLPKDPYSGKDFEYQATEKGFILRCRATFPDNRQSAEPKQFEFRVVEGR